MGSPEGLKKLVEELDELDKLIKSGKLPEHIRPRFFYTGHTVVCGLQTRDRLFRCLACSKDFPHTREVEIIKTAFGDRAKADDPYSCPDCGSEDDFWDITDDRMTRWECKECKHVWDAIDGYDCPECKAHRD